MRSTRHGRRIRITVLLSGLLVASLLGAAPPQARPVDRMPEFFPLGLQGPGAAADFSVMTYNVKGLPWPIAQGRPAALGDIADRLAAMRAQGRQPTIVVLQEAFIADAKAIGDRAGYAYQVYGPYLRAGAGVTAAAGGQWYLGETQPAPLDSGLVVLSDLPITDVARAAFPTDSCAGYDCLAAKGIVMVTVDVPGRGPVSVATTHLNSRGASGAPYERTHVAYRRQTDFLARFIRSHRAPAQPLILAGDFNRGSRPQRIAALTAAMGGAREGLGEAIPRMAATGLPARDAQTIRRRGRDMQFLFDGARAKLEVSGIEVPFGTEAGGEALSDHMGFTIRYRLVPTSGPRA